MICTIKSINETFYNELRGKYPKNETRALMSIVLEHYLSLTRAEITAYPNRVVEQSEADNIHSALSRLKEDEPVQYIIGETEFCGLKIKTDKRALIPRPETEEMVDLVIKHFKANKIIPPARFIDICTGSGCIAIALKKFFPGIDIYAVDISQAALGLAADNASINNVKIKFLRSDVLKWSGKGIPAELLHNQFELIVCNPPYIPNNARHWLAKNVRDYEPPVALFVSEEEPVIFYKMIAAIGKKILVSNGLLYFEVNERFGNTVCWLLKDHGYSRIQLTKDINGKDRFVMATYI